MPRRKPRPDPRRSPRPIASNQRQEEHPDGVWTVRSLSGSSSARTYLCPGCEQDVPARSAHVVAWPAAGDASERRHWHTACWNARDRRRPPGYRR